MFKFRNKLNYAAEAMLNFFLLKTKQKLDTSNVFKFSSKLNYEVYTDPTVGSVVWALRNRKSNCACVVIVCEVTAHASSCSSSHTRRSRITCFALVPRFPRFRTSEGHLLHSKTILTVSFILGTPGR